MKLIKPSWKILEQESGIDGIYKAIERAGRTCYKSEDKMTEDSAKGFVDRMIKSGHGAMLEHGTVYLAMPMETIMPIEANGWGKYTKNPYSKGFKVCEVDGQRRVAVTTNLRVLVENGWLDDLQYICEPTEYHEKRITVHFICDRGVSHEFVRHRVFSFAQESTRYCNYSKDKFNNEVAFILPCWVTDIHSENSYDMELLNNYPLAETENMSPESIEFIRSLVYSESSYFTLLEAGWKPQQARAVLPNALKTELVMTGFINDWKHFFELRCAPNAHPSARELAIPLSEEFIKRGLV
jgi:thymidylate synthase (FAD)